MTTLFLALTLLGLSASVLTGSLVISPRGRVGYSLLQAAPALVLLPLILRTSLPGLIERVESPQTLTNLALVLMAENCLALFTSLAALKAHFGLQGARGSRWFYLPSFSVVAGAVLVMALVMNTTAGVSYSLIGSGGILLLVLLVFGAASITRRLVSSWAMRLELKALASITAVLVSAAIPLLNSPLALQGSAVAIRPSDLVILALVLICGSGAGWGTYMLQSNLRFRREYR